jgi:hypothetical protein
MVAICEPRKDPGAVETIPQFRRISLKRNTMHSILPFLLLLLGSAAAERKIIFGRSIHMRQRSPLQRIRTAQRETTVATDEVATDEAQRILVQDGFPEDDTSFGLDAISDIPLSFDFSMLGSMSMSDDLGTPVVDPPAETTTYPAETTPSPSAVATSAPLDPNADLASLFAMALVSIVFPTGRPAGQFFFFESSLTPSPPLAPSVTPSSRTSASAPAWISTRTPAWCPRSPPRGWGARGPAGDEASTPPTAG